MSAEEADAPPSSISEANTSGDEEKSDANSAHTSEHRPDRAFVARSKNPRPWKPRFEEGATVYLKCFPAEKLVRIIRRQQNARTQGSEYLIEDMHGRPVDQRGRAGLQYAEWVPETLLIDE